MSNNSDPETLQWKIPATEKAKNAKHWMNLHSEDSNIET